MKKKLIATMIAAMTMTAALAGCATNTNTAAAQPAATEQPAQPATEQPAATEQTQAAQPATEAATEEAAGQGEYDPVAFETSGENMTPDQNSTIDISGCDTFTQIVDKLADGQGYANVKIGDADALLVSSGTYEWEPGVDAAIDAEIFIYQDEAPVYLGTVTAGGTAYPLAIKDGDLYVGGNHFMTTYLIDTGNIIELEEGYVEYDTNGNETYYYKTCNAQFEDYDEPTAKSNVEALFDDLSKAEVIAFQPVGEAAE